MTIAIYASIKDSSTIMPHTDKQYRKLLRTYKFVIYMVLAAMFVIGVGLLFIWLYDKLGGSFMGRGRHIGKALFEYAKAFAREKGCHNITLHVWECNPGARAFYEAMGLKPQYTSMELILE